MTNGPEQNPVENHRVENHRVENHRVEQKTSDEDWLEIGRIVAPQGLNGEVRVYPNSDFPERFLEPGERWLLRPNASEPESIQLEGGRFIAGKGLYVIRLAGIRYRDQSEKLRGAKLLVPESDRPYLEDDEYHVMDLLGVAVFHHHTGEQIGTVKDVIAAGNDLLEIALIQAPDAHTNPAFKADVDPKADGELKEQTIDAPSTIGDASASEVRPSAVAPHASMRKKARRRMVKNAKKKKKPKIPTVLIPFVPEIVPIVDLKAGRITVDPPPGLLDNRSDEVPQNP